MVLLGNQRLWSGLVLSCCLGRMRAKQRVAATAVLVVVVALLVIAGLIVFSQPPSGAP